MPGNLWFSLALLWCAVGFGLYYFLAQNSRLRSRFESLCRLLDAQGNHVLLQRILGFLFLGLLSALIILLLPDTSFREFGGSFLFKAAPPWWTWLLIPLILFIGFKAARNPGNLEHYPQIRALRWTPGMLVVSSLSWLLFLTGYEFLFRGFVLHASLALMEPWPAIALNCALYAFAHFYKGPGETFGAIPVGILFCYITLVTGNIWTAVFLHSLMALSNEWFSLKAHPEMHLINVR